MDNASSRTRVGGGWLGHVRCAGSSIAAGGSDTPLPEKMNHDAPDSAAVFARTTRTPWPILPHTKTA
jgi:hypothetical protein